MNHTPKTYITQTAKYLSNEMLLPDRIWFRLKYLPNPKVRAELNLFKECYKEMNSIDQKKNIVLIQESMVECFRKHKGETAAEHSRAYPKLNLVYGCCCLP
jgi:hypothetical protein